MVDNGLKDNDWIIRLSQKKKRNESVIIQPNVYPPREASPPCKGEWVDRSGRRHYSSADGSQDSGSTSQMVGTETQSGASGYTSQYGDGGLEKDFPIWSEPLHLPFQWLNDILLATINDISRSISPRWGRAWGLAELRVGIAEVNTRNAAQSVGILIAV
jgi:hypothetical protein